MAEDLLALARDLIDRGEPFAMATVVRCESPTSAKPGCRAIVRADGAITGWIGGSCAQPVIQHEAAAALEDGEPRLVAIVGTSSRRTGRVAGLVEHRSTCYSGGTLEIYVEPFLPRPLLVIVGESPVTVTLAKIGGALDYRIVSVPSDEIAQRFLELSVSASSFIVIATHGIADEDAIVHALATPAQYVSLVASRTRADAVLDHVRGLGVPDEQLARVKAPAGLEIGAHALEEVAVSILAEIIQHRRAEHTADRIAVPHALHDEAAEAIDPVCGMTVRIGTARFRSDVLARPVYFCCERCRATFEQDPAKYAPVAP